MNKPTKQEVIINVVIFLWIFVVNIAAALFSPAPGWPMFFVTIFFFAMGADTKKIPSIFAGGAMGLVFALLLGLALTHLTPVIGIVPTLIISLFIILGLVIVGGGYLPVVFNNITFAYLTIATIDMEIIGGSFLGWLLMLLIGGAVILGGCLLLLNLLLKHFAKQG